MKVRSVQFKESVLAPNSDPKHGKRWEDYFCPSERRDQEGMTVEYEQGMVTIAKGGKRTLSPIGNVRWMEPDDAAPAQAQVKK